ncbi:hypothetical protein AB9F29_22590, partial [Falsihalocynthiibacter sp. S25ZX9]|uniref:hypothetical protein n=1 Tax=Falsihalocynthiibacter sp. S25ZX9 TaxID=3240870 RepID=UPI00350F364A
YRPNDEMPCIYGGSIVQVVTGNQWIGTLTHAYANCEDLLAVTSDNKTLKRLRGKVRQFDHDRLTVGDLVISKQTDELFRNGEQFTISRIEPS